MTGLRVRHLALKASDLHHFGAQLRLERALAPASLPDGKVYAVRRLPAVRFSPGIGPFDRTRTETSLTRTVERTLGPILADAVHGGRADAGAANCVWFTDMAEVQAIFIAEVARGRYRGAWFWHSLLGTAWLAPDPQNAVRGQFARLVDGAPDLAPLAGAFAQAKRIVGLVALSRWLAAETRQSTRIAAFQRQGEQPPVGNSPSAPGSSSIPSKSSAAAASCAARLLSTPQLQELLAAAVNEMVAPRAFFEAGVALHLASTRPDILSTSSLAKDVLHKMTSALVEACDRQRAIETSFRRNATPPTADVEVELESRVQGRSRREDAVARTLNATPPALENGHSAEIEEASAPDHPASPQLAPYLAVPGAGLLLVVPSLTELGFPRWLQERPAWQLARFGHLLLLGLAQHYRPEGTPEFLRILGLDQDMPLGPERRDWIQSQRQWRVGLDGWLRRRCRLRLHDLAQIDAPVVLRDKVWRCQFQLGQIKLGLRRHALDRDPGWTQWLGLSLRYDFRASAAEETFA